MVHHRYWSVRNVFPSIFVVDRPVPWEFESAMMSMATYCVGESPSTNHDRSSIRTPHNRFFNISIRRCSCPNCCIISYRFMYCDSNCHWHFFSFCCPPVRHVMIAIPKHGNVCFVRSYHWFVHRTVLDQRRVFHTGYDCRKQ